MQKSNEASPAGSRGIFDCRVLSITHFSNQIYSLRLSCPDIAQKAEPGQFVNLKVNQDLFPILRRPFSISQVNQSDGWIEVVWKIVGVGTELMSRLRTGQVVSVLGPLGNGFTIDPDAENAVLVAGGLGVAPFPYLFERLVAMHRRVRVFLGARTGSELVLTQGFSRGNADVELATEDGSVGFRGLVTGPLVTFLDKTEHLDSVQLFACGPTPFLNAMCEIAKKYQVKCQISLETTMACGFGICVGCPVRTADNGKRFMLTCVDGPVFEAGKVALHG